MFDLGVGVREYSCLWAGGETFDLGVKEYRILINPGQLNQGQSSVISARVRCTDSQ